MSNAGWSWGRLRQKVGLSVAVAACMWLVGASQALAWGAKGHRVVAEVSAHYLSAKAIAEIQFLLESNDPQVFLAASVWADEVRPQRRETGPWHYVSRPIGSASFDYSRDCAGDNCVIGKIYEFTRILSDKQLAKPVRAEALKFLIHFVGDIHQPLHAIDNNRDRGGNAVWVRLTGKTNNLHSVWDTDLVDKMGKTSSPIARELIKGIRRDQIARAATSKPEDWAAESFAIAKDVIYPRSSGINTKETPILLPDTYVADMTPIVAERIRLGGIRLAILLNRALR